MNDRPAPTLPGDLDVPGMPLQPIRLSAVCAVCDGDLEPAAGQWRHIDQDGSGSDDPAEPHAPDPQVELACPSCGYGDIREVNVAESWELVERVDVGDGVLTLVVVPPGSGDWTSDGWVCGHCTARLTFPDVDGFDLFFA